MASSKTFWSICLDLLNAGADPNVSSDTWGSSAMDYFYGKNPNSSMQMEVISKMIDSGCDVNKGLQFKYGDTLLMLACVCSNVPYAKMLLSKPNINVDVTNKFGETALIKSVRMANYELVELLMSRGADPSIEGDHGNALAVLPAKCARRDDIFKLLSATKTAKPAPALSPRTRASTTNNSNNNSSSRSNNSNSNRSSPTVLPAAKKPVKSGAVVRTQRRLLDPMQRMTLQAKDTDLHKLLDQMLLEAQNEPACLSPTAPSPLDRNAVVAHTSSPMLRVEPQVSSSSAPPIIEETFEPYRNIFFKKVQMNFACYSDLLIISVLFTAKEGIHKALIMSPDGHSIKDIPEDQIRSQKVCFCFCLFLVHFSRLLKGSKLPDKCLNYLNNVMFPGKSWCPIDDALNKTFSLELLGLEVSHASNAAAFRIAVVYCGKEQTTEEQFFTNKKGSPAFDEFLSVLGDKISLNGFSGFSGNVFFVLLVLLIALFNNKQKVGLMKRQKKGRWKKRRRITAVFRI